MLFTAIAATVVMLPWAINGLPGDDNERPPARGAAGGAAAADRPRRRRDDPRDPPGHPVLDGRADREDLTGTSARVRAKKTDGSWGPWYEAEALEGVGPDTAGPRGTEPVFVGRTTTVQIAVTRPGRCRTDRARC